MVADKRFGWALARRAARPGLVHYSDRGSQYASNDYTGMLEAHGIAISMSRKANPWDNAACESFLKTRQYEEVLHNEYRDLDEALMSIPDFLEIPQAPGPMMAVQPTVEMAKRNSKQRIDPLIEESKALKELVRDHRSRDSGNTILAKEFPGGVLVLTGADSGVGLRSMAARYLFLDEMDGYPGDVDREGDPVNLALVRTAASGGRRLRAASLGTPLRHGRGTRRSTRGVPPTLQRSRLVERLHFQSPRQDPSVAYIGPTRGCPGSVASITSSNIRFISAKRIC